MSLLERFKKKRSRVGLDIGSRSLKLVEIQVEGGEIHLAAVGVKELRPGIVENGEIKDREAFIEEVTTLVDQCDPSIVDVVISLGGQGILSDKLIFKIEPNENVADTILWEASQRSPFDAENITISYKILRQFPERNEVEVLLVAARNEMMQEYIDTLYDAGLRTVAVDVDTYAFNNCYSMESYSEAALKTLVLMDIGYSACRVIFIKDGLFHSSREINTASNFFVSTLQKQLKIPELDAISLLHGKKVAGVSDEDFANTMSLILDDFGSSFDMAFSYFKKTEDVETIDKIVLCGGGTYVPNILSYLSDRFDTTVVRSNPFSFLKYDSELFGNIDPTKISALLTVAVGLALREVD
jgi:type IV pilus assembly protein PilM